MDLLAPVNIKFIGLFKLEFEAVLTAIAYVIKILFSDLSYFEKHNLCWNSYMNFTSMMIYIYIYRYSVSQK